ncbi:hypothetical protein [Variovorax sp. CCNWLW235]|uniref:hypothetical protein n=1 Tax=Variovorax sp. CCNWLW235 TaxID=3127463 RepID=UPI003076916A
MSLQDFKVLTFDVVGTLIDFEGGMLAYLRSAVPDARYFAYARGRFEGAWGYKQADNLHVAQSQYHDIGISKELGIATCWIERRHAQKGSGGTIEPERTEPDYHFRTLAELAELADAVDAGR